jgi:hypothetical protein
VEVRATGKKATANINVDRAFTGLVQTWTPTTAFRRAVICWAGPLAEAAIGEGVPFIQCLEDPGSVEWLQEWIGDGTAMSSDRAGMFGHSQVNRAARTAAAILVKRCTEVEFTAQLLMNTYGPPREK